MNDLIEDYTQRRYRRVEIYNYLYVFETITYYLGTCLLVFPVYQGVCLSVLVDTCYKTWMDDI